MGRKLSVGDRVWVVHTKYGEADVLAQAKVWRVNDQNALAITYTIQPTKVIVDLIYDFSTDIPAIAPVFTRKGLLTDEDMNQIKGAEKKIIIKTLFWAKWE